MCVSHLNGGCFGDLVVMILDTKNFRKSFSPVDAIGSFLMIKLCKQSLIPYKKNKCIVYKAGREIQKYNIVSKNYWKYWEKRKYF